MNEESEILDGLTEREAQIAKAAARLAVLEMQNTVYQAIGRSVVKRFLIYVGIAFVAMAYGKGWLSLVIK